MSILSTLILLLGTVGALIFIFNPPCLEEFYGVCQVKDWESTVPAGIVGLIFNWLFSGSILMVSNYINWRVSSQQQ